MKLIFIVNGTETIVTVTKETLLSDAAQKALKQTGNTERPLSDFQFICNDRTLDTKVAVKDAYHFKGRGTTEKEKVTISNGSLIFLSLKAGQGA